MQAIPRPVLFVIALGLLLPGSAGAQPGGGAGTDAMTNTINSCERRTNVFIGMLRKALNESSVRYERKDALLADARKLEEAMDRTGESWNKDKNRQSAKAHVQEALSAGRGINATMRNRALNPEAEREWVEVRRELNLMAVAFRLQPMKR